MLKSLCGTGAPDSLKQIPDVPDRQRARARSNPHNSSIRGPGIDRTYAPTLVQMEGRLRPWPWLTAFTPSVVTGHCLLVTASNYPHARLPKSHFRTTKT